MATVALMAVLAGLFVPGLAAQGEAPLMVVHVDLDAFNLGFSGSRMEQCWNSPIVQQWRSTTLQQALGMMQAQTGVDINALMTQHRTGQLAMVISGLPMGRVPDTPGQPVPEPIGAFAIHQPGQVDALLTTIRSGLTPAQQTSMDQEMLRQGDVVVFGNDPTFNQTMATAMAGGASALGIEPAPGAFFSGRIDVGRIIQLASQQEPSAAGILNDLGLANLNQLTFTGGFQGQGLSGRGALTFNGPRRGLMNIIGTNRTFGFLGMLPPNSLSAGGFSTAPPMEIFDWIQGMVQTHGGPMAAQNFQQGLMDFQQSTGLSLRDQVLAALGTEYGLAVGGMTGMSGDVALIAEVVDRQVMDQVIGMMIDMANQMMGAMQMGMAQPGQAPPPPAITPMQMTSGDVTYNVLSVPGFPMQVSYAYIGDHLVITSSQNEMNQVAQAVTTGQSLMQAPGFQAVAPGMNPQAAMFSYTDNRQSIQTMSSALMPLMMMAGGQMPPEMFQMMSQLPALSEHMGTRGATLTVLPDRFEFQSHNTSGAEAIVLAMFLSSGAMAAQAQMQPPMEPAPQPPGTM